MIKGLAGKDHEYYDEDKAAFFAASSHNNNEIILIAHSFSRYGPSIREAAEEFVEVRKTCMPFTGKALWLTQKTSDTEKGAESRVWPEWWLRKRVFFNIEIAEAYDYHFFVKAGGEPEYEPWVVDIREPQKKPARMRLNELMKGRDEQINEWVPEITPYLKLSIKGRILKILHEIKVGYVTVLKDEKKGDIAFTTWLSLLGLFAFMLFYSAIKLMW